jgi:SAM-dependent methyltransferase
MTKISDLIKFKNELTEKYNTMSEGLDEVIEIKAVNLKIAEIDNFAVDYKSDLHAIINSYTDILHENAKITSKLKTLIDKVDADIEALADKLFLNAEYQSKFVPYPAFDFWHNENLDKTLRVKMHQYSDWRYPGLQYNIRHKKFVDCMIASDPLYITSNTVEECKEITKEYSELYQSRLRMYTNNDWDKLPANQFGFILIWNYFEFHSIIKIKEFLEKIIALLRPGGVLMFSFNNCDLRESAMAAENKLLSYSSAHYIKNLCIELGYEIISFNDADTHSLQCPWFSWAEIKRPGELNTVKAHQVLGKIIPK